MTDRTRALRKSDLARVASRSLYLQALFSAEREQGPGFAFALLPVIRRLHGDSDARGKALARHFGFFGTHTVLSGYVLGVAARLEERLALGEAEDAGRIEQAKRALASPLAALGDPLFWVTLRPLAGLVGILGMALLPLANPAGPDWRVLVCPLLAVLTYNAVALPFRYAGVAHGYTLADEPGKLLRSLPLSDWKVVLERASAFGYGGLAALAVAHLRLDVDPADHGVGHAARTLAPFVLGAVGAVAGLGRWRGRGVEISLAALLLSMALSIRG